MPLDAIVGSVDRAVDFDRGLRPTSARLRSRWERIAAAQRRGEAFPPVSLYKIGDLYFVRDGHHRVSVAKSLGRTDIDAYVVEVETRLPLAEETLVSDLPLKDHERLFRERVPLPAEARERISVSDPWDFGVLAEAVEAWGFRAMQNRGTYMDRAEVARHWFERGVRAGRRAAEGGRPDRRRRDGDRRLPARRARSLPRAAHARVERRRARAAAPRGAPAQMAPARPRRVSSGETRLERLGGRSVVRLRPSSAANSLSW